MAVSGSNLIFPKTFVSECKYIYLRLNGKVKVFHWIFFVSLIYENLDWIIETNISSWREKKNFKRRLRKDSKNGINEKKLKRSLRRKLVNCSRKSLPASR
jgi:Fic family protein